MDLEASPPASQAENEKSLLIAAFAKYAWYSYLELRSGPPSAYPLPLGELFAVTLCKSPV